MEEKPKLIIDDDDIEILDFDDDIIDESPKVIIEDIEPEVIEIIDDDVEPVKIEELQQPKIEPVLEIQQTVEEEFPVSHDADDTEGNIVEQIPNTELLNETLNINTNNETSVEQTPIINTNIVEKVKPDVPATETKTIEEDTKEENVLKNNEIPEEKNITVKKKIKWKSVILGILIFGALLGTIIALPFISDHVNRKASSQNLNQTEGNTNSTTEEVNSNIDVKKALQGIKDYKNYQYQNINTISTKDNTEQLMSIKNNYIYSFNETRFEIYINKTVADFSYEIKDYYEKLDDVYNLYINDVTTKTYTKKNTTVEDFDKLTNMFPNMINYLINNYNVVEEKLLKVGNEEHIDITLQVPKEIVNNMSVETDRIQNKIDFTKLEQDFVYVDLLFDKNEKLYKIEIEIEDVNASQEQFENSVESAILKYIFTDFNKTVDITLPSL